ncbi:MAG: LacI family transcriptional regulator [Flavobacteriales bacterium CG_4_9_14_3_um_filter_40_17]|nr:MAG: LacI family transcriptional regulator [Flavobacteriales bacterium CG_4_9_14_3_um_filter_40_17]
MKGKITLKQISKELDVSISTVSKALKNSSEISLETREKVQAFAKLYNYRPNNIALSLKNRKTKNIGVIIPEIVHHFFASVISGIEQEANEKGYNVIICLSTESFDKEVINMDMLANGSIDGFIISLTKETQMRKDYHHLQEVINQGMPLVMFDRIAESINCDKVVIDDKKGAYDAVSELIDIGCKNIGLISTVDYVSVGRLRTEGFLEALKDHNIPVNQDAIIKIEDIEHCRENIAPLFNHKIDGIFAVNEIFALTAMNLAREHGLRIPEDVSVIGFTDGELSKYASPALTTVSQNGLLIGQEAARMLIEKIENESEDYKTKIIKTKLIVRKSTKSKS